MRTNEARATVKELVESDDVEAAVAGFIKSRECDANDDVGDSGILSVLKIAEYALLVGPVTDGLRRVIDKWNAIFPPNIKLDDIVEAGSTVGNSTYYQIAPLLEERFDAIGDIAKRRSLILNSSSGVRNMYSSMVCPFETNLRAASRNAGFSAVGSVVSCALALEGSYEGGEMVEEEKLEVVKRSPQLFLTQPMLHLRHLPLAMGILDSDNEIVRCNCESDLVRFNPSRGRVEMIKGIRSWCNVWSPKIIGDRRSDEIDVRLGCPFTFAPKELRVEYFRNVAQLIYDTELWPKKY